MLKLARMGAVIMPANPGFYFGPRSVDDLVDFMVARILDHIGVEQTLTPRLGEPDEVAEIIYFLCSEKTSYISGAEIHVNGGQHV